MADDNEKLTEATSTGLNAVKEKLDQNNKSQAGRDSVRTKNEKELLKSQENTNQRIDGLKKETLANRAAIESSEKATTETADNIEDASKKEETTSRQEAKENIKDSNEQKSLFTGLGKVFSDKLSNLGKLTKDAALNPLKSVGFDPKAVGKSLLSVGAILGLVAFFKSPLFEKLKEFIAKAKPALTAVVDAVKTFISAFKDDIGPLIDSIVGIFKEAFNGVKDIVQGLFSGDASQFLSGMKSIFFDLPIKIVGYVGDAIFSVLENILAIFGIESEFVTNMKNIFRKLPETVEKAVQGVIEFFTVTIPTFFTETLPAKYEEFKTSVKEGVGNLLNSIIEPIVNLKDTVMEKVDMGIAKIKAGVMNVVITIKNGFNSFVDGLKSMANKVIGLLNKIPGVKIDKFKLSTEKPEALVDADDIVAAQRAEDKRIQKMKLQEEQEIADTLEMSMPEQIPAEKMTKVTTNTEGMSGIEGDNYATGAESMVGITAAERKAIAEGTYMTDPKFAGQAALENIKRLEKENAELKEAASSNTPPIIQNNVNNSQMSSTTNKGTRTIPISAPMHPLYAQAQN